jgi:starvation-inducible DNA-binding protein
MYSNPIDLRDATRGKLVALLNTRLADGIDVLNHAKQAHWNVHRRRDLWLHHLLDQVEGEVEECIDLIEERAAALAGTALGTLWLSARRSSLRELPPESSPPSGQIAALSAAIGAFGRSARRSAEDATHLGDAESAAVLGEVARKTERLRFMVEGQGAAHTWR